MNYHIQEETVRRRLEENGLAYAALPLQNGWKVLCTQRGGRILGPFDPETGESVWWLSAAFADAAQFRALLDAGEWNLGGDRLWIAPEMPLFIPDRQDFFNSYTVQPQIDPGNYALSAVPGSVAMAQHVRAKTFQVDCQEKRFSVERRVWQADDPLRTLPDGEALRRDVSYCGLRQRVTLRAEDTDRNVHLESWVMTQVNPDGRLLVPFLGEPRFVDYYEPIPASMYRAGERHLEADVTGDHKYKLGFRAADTAGRAAYLGSMGGGQAYLFLRCYGSNPANLYCGDPYGQPELYGCSLFLYNDDGPLGGFAEFENTGTTISGGTGLRETADDITYHLYFGSPDRLKAIAGALLGIR